MEGHHPSRPWLDGSNSKKRSFDSHHSGLSNKKHKHEERKHQHTQRKESVDHASRNKVNCQKTRQDGRVTPNSSPLHTTVDYHEAVAKLPHPVFTPVAANGQFDQDTPTSGSIAEQYLPELPPIKNLSLSSAPFIHRSRLQYSRGSAEHDLSYERLEFLGDAYLELFASRLIFHRYYNLPAGQMSQLRELLVKNDTLCQYSRAYGFDKKLSIDNESAMLGDATKRNKGLNKILADVFEAYIGAVIVSDPTHGFASVERWLTALWAPKVLAAMEEEHRKLAVVTNANDSVDAKVKSYDPNAKAALQKRIAGHNSKLEYDTYRETIELKGDKLGQNKHFIGVYFTGYGHERKCLGKGEGKNKFEAGNWAAMDAMNGEGKCIVDDAEQRLKHDKEENKKRREEEARQRAGGASDIKEG